MGFGGWEKIQNDVFAGCTRFSYGGDWGKTISKNSHYTNPLPLHSQRINSNASTQPAPARALHTHAGHALCFRVYLLDKHCMGHLPLALVLL
jgi:hypothetical protein